MHREILVTADPALLLEPEPLPEDALKREGLDTGALVGVSVREPGAAAPDIGEQAYHKLLANAADFMVDRSTPTWCSCRWSPRWWTPSTPRRRSHRWPTPTAPPC